MKTKLREHANPFFFTKSSLKLRVPNPVSLMTDNYPSQYEGHSRAD